MTLIEIINSEKIKPSSPKKVPDIPNMTTARERSLNMHSKCKFTQP